MQPFKILLEKLFHDKISRNFSNVFLLIRYNKHGTKATSLALAVKIKTVKVYLFLCVKPLIQFRRSPCMKSLGNQGTSVHCMKTCTNLTGIQTHLPFHKEVHSYSICQLLGCHNFKPKDWYSALSWHSCTDITYSILFHEENQGQSRRGLPSPHNAGSQLRGMSRILQCSYRKPWWEPDCRFNVKLNHTK